MVFNGNNIAFVVTDTVSFKAMVHDMRPSYSPPDQKPSVVAYLIWPMQK